jgi:large subunit ribosomal protein L21
MIAVVDIAGKQFKVQEQGKYYVPRLDADPESELTFDKVLLTADNGSTEIGTPYLDGTRVAAKVLEHLKDDKVIIFKKKRRKGYQKKAGHRQLLTRIEVTKISAGKAAKSKKTVTEKTAPPETTDTPAEEA